MAKPTPTHWLHRSRGALALVVLLGAVLGLLAARPERVWARHPPHHAMLARVAAPSSAPRMRVQPHPSTVRLAVTVDDLPGGGPEFGEYTHARIVADIVEALQKHGLRHVTGFVVGSMLDGHPERNAAIESWIGAGYLVGNHTYTHRSLSDLGLASYLEDVKRNEPLLAALEQRTHQHEHYFRTPYLDEGDTEAERRGLTRYLSSHNYRNARVSVDFSDWAWADAYGRCLQRNDPQSLALLDQSYLENAGAYLGWSATASRSMLGRSAPQVLLLHANVATARNLDALLSAYERSGVRFITLAEALNDPFYAVRYDSSGGNIFVQASRKLGRAHPPWMVLPSSLLDLACKQPPATATATSAVNDPAALPKPAE